MNSGQASYFLIIQTVAVVIAIIGFIATISWNRKLARRRATIDLLVADQTNEKLLTMRGQLNRAAAEGSLAKIVEEGIWSNPENHFLGSTCNRYEILAVGIKEGIIDERIYKRYWRTALVQDWMVLKPAVKVVRNKNPRAYSDFEELANKWADESEKKLIRI